MPPAQPSPRHTPARAPHADKTPATLREEPNHISRDLFLRHRRHRRHLRPASLNCSGVNPAPPPGSSPRRSPRAAAQTDPSIPSAPAPARTSPQSCPRDPQSQRRRICPLRRAVHTAINPRRTVLVIDRIGHHRAEAPCAFAHTQTADNALQLRKFLHQFRSQVRLRQPRSLIQRSRIYLHSPVPPLYW